VLAKAIGSESTFEVQARFSSTGKPRMITITTAVSITTGVAGEPDVDIFTEMVDGKCILGYYVEGKETDFATPVNGLSFEGGGDGGNSDYLFFTGSGIMYSVFAKNGSFGCVLNSKLCLPPSFVQEQKIVGLLGTPDGVKNNEWTTSSGQRLSQADTGKAAGYSMCTTNWCVRKEEDSIFGYLEGTKYSDFFNCDFPYDPNLSPAIVGVPDECEECCAKHPVAEKIDECLEECTMADEGFGVEQCLIDMEDSVVLSTAEKKCSDPIIFNTIGKEPGEEPEGKSLEGWPDANPGDRVDIDGNFGLVEDDCTVTYKKTTKQECAREGDLFHIPAKALLAPQKYFEKPTECPNTTTTEVITVPAGGGRALEDEKTYYEGDLVEMDGGTYCILDEHCTCDFDLVRTAASDSEAVPAGTK